jgi:peptidoglycan/xylan/chitin deacetylase (PgdA/CDA1 family)/glycosyltransferase involved in cell wall biosynthesis
VRRRREAAELLDASTSAGERYVFSVVVPTYQRREVVVRSVQALDAQRDAPLFEAVVVVDGSTDGTAEALRSLDVSFRLTVLEQANAGRASACNAGAAAASGEYLLFLDDDMEADPQLLCQHLRSLAAGADAVLGHVPLHPASPPSFLAAGVGEWGESRRQRIEAAGGALELHDLLTGQMSISRELFAGIGGFDTDFTRAGSFGNEDLDLGHRLRSTGARIVFNAGAISRQRYVVAPRAYLRQWRQAGRADVLFACKHPALTGEVFRPYERATATERALGRLVRVPLRELVLALSRLRLLRGPGLRWFYRVRNLEYFRGVEEAGGLPRRRSVRVLCYHAIADLHGMPVLAPYGVPPARFRRQLAVLRLLFRPLTADEFLRFLGGGGVPRRALLVTFDDCYADLLTAALPLLRASGTPALAFAVTARVGKTNDWDEPIGAPQVPLLAAAGLRAAAAGGIAVGSHSRTHRPLDRLPAAELADELRGSLTDLESLLPAPAALLAYPHGAYNTSVRSAAAEAGYVGAFTVAAGLVEPGGDRYALPRLEIFASDTGWRFLRKVILAGAPNLLGALRRSRAER